MPSRSDQRNNADSAGPLSSGPVVLAELEFPQLLIFDWHGTLVDTLDAVYASVQDVLLELEPLGILKSLADESTARNEAEASVLRYLRIYRKLHPTIIAEKKHSRTELFDIIFGANEHAKVVAHKAYNARYRQHAGGVTPFQDGLPHYLKLFRAAGIRLAVATNRSREFLEAELLALTRSTGFDWSAAFDVLVCADDVDSYKPWPDVLMRAVAKTSKHLDDKACTWYFGDSPKMGETIYSFALRELPGAFIRAWGLEVRRLKAAGKPVWSSENEILQPLALSFLLYAVLLAAFGWVMLPFLAITVFWGAFQLTSANYIEHYGLLRKKLDNGRYERCEPHHSWNSNHVFSNWALFHLQRHSDHHANPTRRFQSLRHFSGLPELPSGYTGMYLLAWIPPLWFSVMNPRLIAAVDRDRDRISFLPSARERLIRRYCL